VDIDTARRAAGPQGRRHPALARARPHSRFDEDQQPPWSLFLRVESSPFPPSPPFPHPTPTAPMIRSS